MPEATSIAKFLRACKTGQTDITKVLTKAFEKPTTYQGTKELTALENDGSLKQTTDHWEKHLKKFIKKALISYNPFDALGPGTIFSGPDLVEKIIKHIENWPNPERGNRKGKEQLRQILVAAINAATDHPIKFFWKLDLLEDAEEDILIKRQDGTDIPIYADPNHTNGLNNVLSAGDPIIVTFVSPSSKIREEAVGANYIEVTVGPDPDE